MTEFIPTSVLVKPKLNPHTGGEFRKSGPGFKVITQREGNQVDMKWVQNIEGKQVTLKEQTFKTGDMMDTLVEMAKFAGFKGAIVDDIPHGETVW